MTMTLADFEASLQSGGVIAVDDLLQAICWSLLKHDDKQLVVPGDS